MKKLLLILFSLLLLFPNEDVLGHSGPPFISINNNTNLANPAGSGSVFFKVPNEIAAQSFIVNENLNFKVDTSLLPVDPSQVNASDFLWEFANGKTGAGLSSSTTYSKAGSYVVILKVKDPNYQDPIELESMQVNILPNKSTRLPKAIIKVEGKKITDPFKEPVLIAKNSEVAFSAEDSEGNIRKYSWDFGDGAKLTEGEEVKHKFDFSQPYAYSFFPILRVEDENGVYSDAVVQIAIDEQAKAGSTASQENNGGLNWLSIILISGGIILLAAAYLFWRRFSGNKSP